jgi:hypothetical protein
MASQQPGLMDNLLTAAQYASAFLGGGPSEALQTYNIRQHNQAASEQARRAAIQAATDKGREEIGRENLYSQWGYDPNGLGVIAPDDVAKGLGTLGDRDFNKGGVTLMRGNVPESWGSAPAAQTGPLMKAFLDQTALNGMNNAGATQVPEVYGQGAQTYFQGVPGMESMTLPRIINGGVGPVLSGGVQGGESQEVPVVNPWYQPQSITPETRLSAFDKGMQTSAGKVKQGEDTRHNKASESTDRTNASANMIRANKYEPGGSAGPSPLRDSNIQSEMDSREVRSIDDRLEQLGGKKDGKLGVPRVGEPGYMEYNRLQLRRAELTSPKRSASQPFGGKSSGKLTSAQEKLLGGIGVKPK